MLISSFDDFTKSQNTNDMKLNTKSNVNQKFEMNSWTRTKQILYVCDYFFSKK